MCSLCLASNDIEAAIYGIKEGDFEYALELLNHALEQFELLPCTQDK